MATETNYPLDPLFQKAAAVIASKLGVDAKDVTISRNKHIASSKRSGRFVDAVLDTPVASNIDENTPVDLYVTVHKSGIDVNETDTSNAIREVLKELPAINAVAQMTPPEDLAKKLAQQLREAADKTTFDTGLLDWPGFDPKIAKTHATHDHAIQSVTTNAYGVKFNISIPARKDQDKSIFTKSVSDGITAREVEIKEILASRVEKYIKENMTFVGKPADEITKEQAKAREAIAALSISTNTSADAGYIEVTLRSPKQAQALKDSKTGHEWNEPDNADELRKSNPLHDLTAAVKPATDKHPEIQPQLHRALGRAFFFDKNKKHIPGFVQIAGNSDIRTAIAKEMIRVLPQHPEKKPAFEAILNSDLFKNHQQWRGAQNAGDALPTPSFERIAGENDMMEIQFTLTRRPNAPDPIQSLLDGLIGGTVIQTASAPAAGIANSTVDLGAIQKPDLLQAQVGAIGKVLADYKAASLSK